MSTTTQHIQTVVSSLPFVLGALGIYFFIIRPPIAFWRSFPTLDEYLQAQGSKRPAQGVTCIYCGSRSIKNWGVRGADDRLRLHICNNCGNTLFRSRI